MSRKPCNTNTHRKQPASTPSTIIAKPSTAQKRCAAILKNGGSSIAEMLARHEYHIAGLDRDRDNAVRKMSNDNHLKKDAAWRQSVECLTRDDLADKRYIDIKHEMTLDHAEATKAYHPELRAAWRDNATSSVIDLAGDRLNKGDLYVWFVTIINRDWHTKPDEFAFDHSRAKQWVRNELNITTGKGPDRKSVASYISVIEFEMLNANRNGAGRQRYDQIHPHVHALVWGTDREAVEARLAALGKGGRTKLRSPDATDVEWEPLTSSSDLIRVLAYMFKSPSGAKRRLRNKESGRFSHVNDTLTLVGRAQLILLLSDFKLSGLVCASGEGALVRRSVVSALAAERAATRRADAKRRKLAGVRRSKKSKCGAARAAKRKQWKARPRKP
jgi:hypothetical protein